MSSEQVQARRILELTWLCLALLGIATLLFVYHDTGLTKTLPQPRAVISEFLASNNHSLRDKDGQHVDWIEIHNQDKVELDLEGWYLTDDKDRPTQWQLPSIKLAADGYLVVLASAKDLVISDTEVHTNFRLASEGEYLALIAPDGTIAWEYILEDRPQYADVSYGIDSAMNERYFTTPTPGTANGTAQQDKGPILSAAKHSPALLTAGDALTVRIAARPTSAPITGVTLHYRVMFGETSQVAMYDNGTHGDQLAGDHVYAATLPGTAARTGKMVRYAVTAQDGAGYVSHWPFFQDPLNAPQYAGTMVVDPTAASALPVLYWFVEEPAAADTERGTRASVFYAPSGVLPGTLYDNVLVRLRGISARAWPKKSYKFDFNQGYHFRFSMDEDPVEEFNLNTTYSDKAYIRQVLAWETYRDAGAPHSISFPIRVQQNGAFHSLSIFVEQPDERYLTRQGLDPSGALYKMYNPLDSSTQSVQKRTRLYENNQDLQRLANAMRLLGPVRENYLYDHVDIPAAVNYLAATALMHDNDHVNLNYYLYRDTEGTGEWQFLPWDKDLTFGRNNLKDHRGVLNDVIWADHDPQSHPLHGDAEHPRINGNWNAMINALYGTPSIREMYLRRLRTLMDQLLQPPGTPAQELHYERRIDELVAQIAPVVARDSALWPVHWGEEQTFDQAIAILQEEYLAVRREHLYQTHGPDNGGIIPQAQPADTTIEFGPLEYAPQSGISDHEYLTLLNPNSYAVDLSQWTIEGDIRYQFRSGVVIPANGTLYVSPNVNAFRSRATLPTGGTGLFVQGNYRGQLSDRGGTLRLYRADGTFVASKTFIG